MTQMIQYDPPLPKDHDANVDTNDDTTRPVDVLQRN